MCPESFLGGLMLLSPQEIGACDLCCDVCIGPYSPTGRSLCVCKSFVQCAAGVFNDTQLSSHCHSFRRILCAREMTDYHVDMEGGEFPQTSQFACRGGFSEPSNVFTV